MREIGGLVTGLLMAYLLQLDGLYTSILLFLISNFKMLPLAYAARLTPSLARLWLLPVSPPDGGSLFKPYSTPSRACLLECDVNLHKSNSTYLVDLDISRTELLSRLFSHALRGIPRGRVALAAVDISFRREIRPLGAYDTRSCVLAWDEKWIWVLSYHVQLGAVVEEEGGDWVAALVEGKGRGAPRAVFAVAVSQCVAKSGRRTVRPAALLEASGFDVGDSGIAAQGVRGLELLEKWRV